MAIIRHFNGFTHQEYHALNPLWPSIKVVDRRIIGRTGGGNIDVFIDKTGRNKFQVISQDVKHPDRKIVHKTFSWAKIRKPEPDVFFSSITGLFDNLCCKWDMRGGPQTLEGIKKELKMLTPNNYFETRTNGGNDKLRVGRKGSVFFIYFQMEGPTGIEIRTDEKKNHAAAAQFVHDMVVKNGRRVQDRFERFNLQR